MCSKEELKMYLRLDFDKYIRPNFIKDKCEFCGEDNELHLHHYDKYFSTLLNETLIELNLNNVDNFTKEQTRIIKYFIRGRQLSINYLTLCKDCHIKLHKGYYENKNKSKFKCDKSKEDIITYLDKLINKPLCKEDKNELINFIHIRKDGKLLKSISLLNEYIKEIGLSYNIISKRKRIYKNGIKKQNRCWIIYKI